MAKNAIMIDSLGNRYPRHISQVTESEIGNVFICSTVLDDGNICGAPMRPCRRNDTSLDGYFYLAHHDCPHRSGCDKARSRTKITIEKLDHRCEDISGQELYDFLNRDKLNTLRRTKKPPTPTEPKGTDYLPPPSGNQNDEKDIQSKLCTPRTLEEYIRLLKALSTTDEFTDKLVFDLILDERTIDSYRRMNLPLHPFVITARRTFPQKHNVRLENTQWLLIDFWSSGHYRHSPFVFLLNLTVDAKEKLYDLCQIKPSVKIYVYSIFKKHPDIPRMYVSETVKAHMICAEDSE